MFRARITNLRQPFCSPNFIDNVRHLLISSQDPRFNKIVDKKTGYRTTSILCMPILDYEQEVVGVAQIMNKMADGKTVEFTQEDEKVGI